MDRNRLVRYGELGPVWLDPRSLNFRFILGPWLQQSIIKTLPARPVRLKSNLVSPAKLATKKNPLSSLDLFMIGPDLLKELASEKPPGRPWASLLRVVDQLAMHPSSSDPACLTFTALFECSLGDEAVGFQSLPGEHASWPLMPIRRISSSGLILSDYAAFHFELVDGEPRLVRTCESAVPLVDGCLLNGQPLLVDESGAVQIGASALLKGGMKGVSLTQTGKALLWSENALYILNAEQAIPLWHSNSPIIRAELFHQGWAVVSTEEAPFCLLDLRIANEQEMVWIKLSRDFFLDQSVQIEKIVSLGEGSEEFLALLCNERRAFLVKIVLNDRLPNIPCLPYPLDLPVAQALIGTDLLRHEHGPIVFSLFADGQCWYQQLGEAPVEAPTYWSEEVQSTIDPAQPKLELFFNLELSTPPESPPPDDETVEHPPLRMPKLSHAAKLLADRWPVNKES